MTDELIFRMVAAIPFSISVLISASFRRRVDQKDGRISSIGEGPVILNLRRLFGLGLWLSSLVYFINPNWIAWASLNLPDWLRWFGAAMMFACTPLFYWIFRSLGTNITPTVSIRKEHRLVTHGPYRWVRHPLYTVGSLFFVGFCLLAANWFLFLTLVLGSAVLLLRTPLEEQRLINCFGDEYRLYMQRTGRFLPRLKQIESTAEHSFR